MAASNIGQSYVELSRYLDYICPMVYPSHYSFGYGGLKYPDTKPFQDAVLPLHESVLSDLPAIQPVYDMIQEYNAQYAATDVEQGET